VLKRVKTVQFNAVEVLVCLCRSRWRQT